jgi:hypothetical protein
MTRGAPIASTLAAPADDPFVNPPEGDQPYGGDFRLPPASGPAPEGPPITVRMDQRRRFIETGVTVPEEPSVRDLNAAAMRAAFESEYGAEPLELLHAKLAATEDEWARGWARFGPGNVAERRVKSLICLYALEQQRGSR